MRLFNVGAQRSSIDGARLSAANDLVQRTLAQHGLAPQMGQTGGQSAGVQQPNIPSLESVLATFTGTLGNTGAPQAVLPKGAEFKQATFTCTAGSRDFRTYIPASAGQGVTGVVVMLHGCTQNPEDFAAGTGMNVLAEKHRFVVVYPAQSRGDNAQSCWNWFSRNDQRRGRGEPDIIAGMTQKVCTQYGIGREQTFVAGLSAGAAMAVILGETYPDVFGAIGAHSGLPFGAAKDVTSAFAAMAGNALSDPSRPHDRPHDGPYIRTIVFHGTADATVHPSNGDAIARQALDVGARQSIETTQHGEISGRTYTRSISSDADGTSTLEHWSINGMGHAWSGGQAKGSYTDQSGPNASAEMIRFFFNTSDTEC